MYRISQDIPILEFNLGSIFPNNGSQMILIPQKKRSNFQIFYILQINISYMVWWIHISLKIGLLKLLTLNPLNMTYQLSILGLMGKKLFNIRLLKVVMLILCFSHQKSHILLLMLCVFPCNYHNIKQATFIGCYHHHI